MSGSFARSIFGSGSSGQFYGSGGPYIDDNDDRGESIVSRFEKTRDAVILLVDCAKYMMQPGSGGNESPFHMVMKLVVKVIQERLIQSNRNELGVVFYNTREEKNTNGFPSIFEYIPLDEPDSQAVRSVRKLLDAKAFESNMGSAESECEFHKVLWACSSIFTARKNSKTSRQRVMLFTCNDQPNHALGSQHYESLRAKAQQKATDLDELGISIVLNPVAAKGGQAFHVGRYFAHILLLDEEDGIQRFEEDAAERFEDLQSRCMKRIYQKRTLASCKLSIGSEIAMGLKLYSTLRPATKGSPVTLDGSKRRLVCETKWLCKTTGAYLDDYQIRKYFPFGGVNVEFTSDEIKEIKSFGKSGIRLMGFKPKNSVRWEYNIKPTLFVRPDERSVTGSTTLFWALVKEMLALDKVAIVRVVYRDGAIPRFAALLPVEASDGDSWDDSTGMHLVFLPYAEDLRDVEIPPAPIADDAKVAAARRIIAAATAEDGVDPATFDNPALQQHYASLEAMAEDAEDIPQITDQLQPADEDFEGCKTAIDELEALVAQVEEPPRSDSKGQKRKAGGGAAGGRGAKRVRVEVKVEEYRRLAEQGQLRQFKVAGLKDYCRAHDLPLAGKKAELIARIRTHLGM